MCYNTADASGRCRHRADIRSILLRPLHSHACLHGVITGQVGIKQQALRDVPKFLSPCVITVSKVSYCLLRLEPNRSSDADKNSAVLITGRHRDSLSHNDSVLSGCKFVRLLLVSCEVNLPYVCDVVIQ